ncbi:MAG: hypothetical protein V3S55_06300 [Nitrospiraceae bacterium]
MARIRTIKPEYWTDEKIVELSFPARLLFIGLWNFADDEGRLVYSPKRLKLQIFPADDLDISALFGEIRGELLATLYKVDNIEYLQVNGFSKHQKIDKRSSSKLPPPPPSPESPRIPPTEGIKEGIKEGKGIKKDPSGPKKEKSAIKEDPKVGLNDLTVKMFHDFAKAKAPDVNILLELERFSDHWRSKGRRFKDNSAAFRNWLRKAQEFHDERKGANGAERVEISSEQRLENKARLVKRLIRTSAGGDSIITPYDLKEMVEKSLITQEQAEAW